MILDRYEIVVKLPKEYGQDRVERIATSLVQGRGELKAEVYQVGVEHVETEHEIRDYCFTAVA